MKKLLDTTDFSSTEDLIAQRVYLVSVPYTVEPGDPECSSLFRWTTGRPKRRISSGGIGRYRKHENLYYYKTKAAGYPDLIDFLSLFTTVEGNYANYYSDNIDEIERYFVSYLEFFTSSNCSDYIPLISEYMVDNRDKFDTKYFGENIVLDTAYFDYIFYKCAWRVARNLFSESLLCDIAKKINAEYLLTSGVNPKSCRKDPDGQAFINIFIDLERTSFSIRKSGTFHYIKELTKYDEDPNKFWIDDVNGILSGDKDRDEILKHEIICNIDDYSNSLKPFAFFLSNFSLILASYMALKRYGQCHFTLGWEVPYTHDDLSRDKWPHQ